MRRKAKLTMPSPWLWAIIGSIGVLLVLLAFLVLVGEGRTTSTAATESRLLSSWAAPGLRYEATSTDEQRFPVSGDMSLRLDADVGAVTIQGADVREVHAVAEVIAWGASVEESEEALRETSVLMVQQDDGTVHLQSSLLRRLAGVRTPQITWSVTVPEDMAVVVECSVGDVTVQNHRGDLDITSGVGNVSVENIGAGNEVSVDAHVGAVFVSVPRDASLTFAAQTMSGKVKSKLDADEADTGAVSQGARLAGRLGSGSGGSLTIMLEAGDIELRHAK